MIQRVVYELFEWEDPQRISDDEVDEVRRQIRLENDTGASTFVAWISYGGPVEFALAFGESTFYSGPPDDELDVSSSPIWRGIVGAAPTIDFRDTLHQTIEIRATAGLVYCCCFDSDRVFVMRELKVPTLRNRT